MGLDRYQRKRNFQRTREPAGSSQGSASGRLYVMQKHASRQLHYDLRLELDGVLLSWALPKGPSLDPSEKRLAVHVEDHPIEYADFEGIIPKGQYGGGTVMLWDHGQWTTAGSARQSYRRGKLKFQIAGEKLRGAWTLVRMTGPASDGGKNWLLIKERDDEARSEDEYAITDEQPFSISSGRILQQIADDGDRVWSAGGEVEGRKAPARRRKVRSSGESIDAPSLPNARPAVQPARLAPHQPRPAEAVPSGGDWLHEIALTGRRMLGMIEPQRIRLLARDGEDCTARLPEIARAVSALAIDQAILDGVVTALSPGGACDSAALEDALMSGRTAGLILYVFDLPYCQGQDLRRAPLAERKGLLRRLIDGRGDRDSCIRFCDHIEGDGPAVYEHACRLGVPAIVSKGRDSHYEHTASPSWLKVACRPVAGSVVGEHTGTGGDAIVASTVAAPAAPATSAKGGPGVVLEPGFYIHGVLVTHPERLMYGEHRITKRMLALYFDHVAEWILPHIVRRPLSLYRCPKGHEQDCFFQKHLNDTSKHLRGVVIPRKRKGEESHIVIDDVAGLMTLVQRSALEIHPWGCREDNVERPDRLVFDLDPGPDVPWQRVAEGATALNELLLELGLHAFVKTSGGKGLHVVVPLVRRCGWDELKDFAGAVAQEIVRRHPNQYVATMTKARRAGKIFIDYFRNNRGATCVAPYSTRARAGAPVSTPLRWDELEAGAAGHNVTSLLRRLATAPGDPWEGFFECRQSITRPMWARLER